MAWQIFLTQEAEEMLLAIRDRRVKKILYSRAMKLQNSPEKQGKPWFVNCLVFLVSERQGNATGLFLKLMAAGRRFGL